MRDAQLNIGVFHSDIYFSCCLRVLAVLVMFSGDFNFYWDAEGPGDCGSRVFMPNKQIDGMGDKGSGDTTVNLETLFEAFLNTYLTSASTCEVSGFLKH